MMHSMLRHGITCGMIFSFGVPAMAAVDSISITSTSSWSTGFNGEIRFTNDGPETIEGWSLTIDDGPDFNSAWNCQWSSDSSGNRFADAGWNSTLAPGQSITIGYGADGSLEGTTGSAVFNGVPIEIRYPGLEDGDSPVDGTVDPVEQVVEEIEDFSTSGSDDSAAGTVDSILVRVTSSWSGGFNGEIQFTNVGTEPIDGWTLVIENGPAINSAWNCQWTSDGILDQFDDEGWNGSIPPGGGIVIGYGADGSLQESITSASFNGMPVEVSYAGSDMDDPQDDDEQQDDNDEQQDEDGSDDASEGNDDSSDDSDDGQESGGDSDTCEGDIDGNGSVDVDDMLALLNSWGPCSGCAADFDASGEVEVNDMLALLAAWGVCPIEGPEGTDKRIVAYYIEWGIYGRDYQPADMPLDQITHVNYAFANIGDDGRIAIGDPYAAIDKSYPGDTWDQPYRGTYNQLNNVLRAQYPHIKTLISVGGWTWSGKFSDVALTQESRDRFSESCVDFIRTYNFDGVDIDWEYPVCCGLSSNTYRPEDRGNYTLLMESLRDHLDQASSEDGRDYLLTIASAGGVDKLVNYELAQIASHLDWVNTMSYDFMGAWDLSLTGHHSALYANPANPSPSANVREDYNADGSVQPWLDAGVPADKIVMGVPFYGRAWGGVDPTDNGLFQSASLVPSGTWDDWSSGATGINDYTQIKALLATGQYTRYWDDVSKVPWAWSPTAQGGHFISYDDPESMQLKMDYINEKGLGGAMFWEITGDRENELLDVIHQAIGN